MLRLAFDFIITWRETRTRPNAYLCFLCFRYKTVLCSKFMKMIYHEYTGSKEYQTY